MIFTSVKGRSHYAIAMTILKSDVANSTCDLSFALHNREQL